MNLVKIKIYIFFFNNFDHSKINSKYISFFLINQWI
jgi:hypothetical protein